MQEQAIAIPRARHSRDTPVHSRSSSHATSSMGTCSRLRPIGSCATDTLMSKTDSSSSSSSDTQPAALSVEKE